MKTQTAETLIKLAEVKRQTTLSKTTIYEQIKSGLFPKPRKLGVKRVAWSQLEIDAYKRGAFKEGV